MCALIRRVFALLSCALLTTPVTSFSQRLTPLSQSPHWDQLNRFQETITHDEFVCLLESVYAPNGAAAQWIKIDSDRSRYPGKRFRTISSSGSRPACKRRKPVPRYWTSINQLNSTDKAPLAGIKIAIDPGHLGGKWAQMEERWFQMGSSTPVTEGDLDSARRSNSGAPTPEPWSRGYLRSVRRRAGDRCTSGRTQAGG